jgi:hypothetical protein
MRQKILLRELKEAVTSMTSANRADWWVKRGRLLPKIPYYAISGTMADLTVKGQTSELLNSPFYGSKSVDYLLTWRRNYYNMASLSGCELNDGYTTVAKSRFWPNSVVGSLPQPARSEFLGVLGSHHWGLAVPVVFKNNFFADFGQERTEENQFPRQVLLESLVTYTMMNAD